MSYGIMPYAVSLDGLRGLLGAEEPVIRDALARVRERVGRNAAYLDENYEDEISRGCPNALVAVEHLLRRKAGPDWGSMYAWAFELLCKTYGYLLDNGAWSGIRTTYIESVDERLAPHGVSFLAWLNRRAPIELPPNLDAPTIGYLTRDEALQTWQKLDVDELRQIRGDEGASAIELFTWLEACVSNELDLVIFYY